MKFLRHCDFLSPEIVLHYEGDERHSSVASGLMSLGLLALIIYLVFYISTDFIFHLNPSAFYYNKYLDDLGIYPLNSSGFFHFVNFEFLEGSGLSKIDLKSYVIIGVAKKDATYISNNIPTEHDHYIYELCDKSDAGEFYDLFDSEILSYYVRSYCIKKFYDSKTKTIISNTDESFQYPYIIHGAARSDYIDYGIYIQECQNISDYNDNYCNSQAQIKTEFDYFTKYAILYANQVVDVNNYSYPITYSFPRVSNSFSPLSYTANHLNFNPLRINSHAGIIFDSDSTVDSYIYDYNEKIVLTDMGNGIHGSFHFWLQNNCQIYDRTYKKLQDISGSIDGIIEILMLIIDFVNQWIFNDFQVLYDFNKEIEKNVIKNKGLRRMMSFNYNNSNNINYGNNKKHRTKFITRKNMSTSMNSILNFESPLKSSERNLEKKNNPKIKRVPTEISQTNLEKKFQKIKWNQLLCRFKMDCLRKEYVNYINDKREKIISEEMMLKYYFAIKKVKENLIASANAKLFELNNNGNNNNNNNNIYTNNSFVAGVGNLNNSTFSQRIVSKRTFNSNFDDNNSDKDKESNFDTYNINNMDNDNDDDEDSSNNNKYKKRKIGVSHIRVKSKENHNKKKLRIVNNYV